MQSPPSRGNSPPDGQRSPSSGASKVPENLVMHDCTNLLAFEGFAGRVVRRAGPGRSAGWAAESPRKSRSIATGRCFVGARSLHGSPIRARWSPPSWSSQHDNKRRRRAPAPRNGVGARRDQRPVAVSAARANSAKLLAEKSLIVSYTIIRSPRRRRLRRARGRWRTAASVPPLPG